MNILTVDGKYSFRKKENLQQTTEMQFSKKQKSFIEFFAAFLKSTLHFEHLKNKMTLRALVLPNLRIAKIRC